MEGEIVMNIKITSKELVATDAIKDYIEKKAERLVKYFGEEIDVYATIKTEGSPRGFSQWPLECLQRVIVDSYGSLFEPLSGFSELLILSEAALSL